MYKAQFKSRNAYESWTTIGTYGSESAALDKTGSTVFSA